MKYKKIIASDMDGTLLPFGEDKLDPRVLELIGDLRKKGVLFVPASGRSIHQLHSLFEPIKEQMSYLSENGGVVWFENTDIAETPFPQELLYEMTDYVYNHPHMESYLTSATNQYIYAKSQEKEDLLMSRFVGRFSRAIKSLDEIPDTPVKMTAFCWPGADPYFFDLRKKFGDRSEVMKAGPDVVDFGLANKGIGLKILTDYLGLTRKDTFAFGDNYNDVGMLDYAGTSYLVDTEDKELASHADFLIPNPLQTLEELYLKL